ncbi:hypothetical protein [Mycolicibacterium sp. XJ1819]
MSTTYDTEPQTATVAAAWASSALGQPDDERRLGFAEPTQPVGVPDVEARRPVARHALIALALAGGIGAGAALGLFFVDLTPGQQTVAPGIVSTPSQTVAVTPDGGRPPQAPPVAPAPANGPSSAGVGTPLAPTGEPVAVAVPTEAPTAQAPAPAEPPAPQDQAPADPGVEPEAPPEPEPPLPPLPPHPTPDDLGFDPGDPGPEPPPPPVQGPGDIAVPKPQPPKPQPPKPDLDISAGLGS